MQTADSACVPLKEIHFSITQKDQREDKVPTNIGNVTVSILLSLFRFCHDLVSNADDTTKYELFGLTVHMGTLDMGHYIAFTKREGKWFLFNDENYQ